MGTARSNLWFLWILGIAKSLLIEAATGYLKLGARYYNPTTGRFTQPDPAALYGGYAYAADNPTNLTDPSGASVIGELAGGLVGGVIAIGGCAVLGVETAGLGCGAAIAVGVAAGTAVGGLSSGDSNYDAGLAGSAGGFGSAVLTGIMFLIP